MRRLPNPRTRYNCGMKAFAPFILAIVCLTMGAHQISQSLADGLPDPAENMVARWDERLQPLRRALPAGIRQIGYLDSSMIRGSPEDFDGEEFFLMQYSVAPIALELGARQPWIIGNFDRDTQFHEWLEERIGNYRAQSFGFGLYLIQKAED